MRPVLVDLYCGMGGAAKGYSDAGFKVIGVDIVDQPHYPFDFRKLDVKRVEPRHLGWYDAVHASPPCQAHSIATGTEARAEHEDLIPFTRELLIAAGKPWVMENVVGAPMHRPIQLCGSSFGLGVRRHRLFETWSDEIVGKPCCHHEQGSTISVAGNFGAPLAEAQAAMGIDWGDKRSLTQAVPPAFTRWIGDQLIRAV